MNAVPTRVPESSLFLETKNSEPSSINSWRLHDGSANTCRWHRQLQWLVLAHCRLITCRSTLLVCSDVLQPHWSDNKFNSIRWNVRKFRVRKEWNKGSTFQKFLLSTSPEFFAFNWYRKLQRMRSSNYYFSFLPEPRPENEGIVLEINEFPYFWNYFFGQ